ncbi:acyl-CoA dehydrogenase family protein [Cryobacterium sp. TMT1-66-1]|uniref:acyl-CoA dehydrogenase family protein n=1 Tax=Cryobacterium sp. TMT1-66-1 TaxID=1259242 RepID=UPI00106BEB93|nr:acyl-CoA dehydrogenase [Cryobacterium sp. TMT1-66-1]TFD06318.1 acyl-CoA dehydrogenase [Cryobacterium sp. TMT1-66-1]
MSGAFARALDLDRHLGDATSTAAIIRDSDTISFDERSEFPQVAVDALNEWGLQRSYVPIEFGGEMTDVLAPMLQIRHIARRDMTVAVAHGKSFLGAVCAWVAGGTSAKHLAPIVLSGAPVSWGLTEQGRGSDILRTATHYRTDGTMRIEGGKWPINNATRGRAMCVLVRTRNEIGPRSLSLVLADKEELDPASFEYRPKVQTHGIKGADISGIDWHGTEVPADRLVGESGKGLDLVLRALQLTRPTCTALSLGGADRAVEAVLDFVTNRRLYGRRLLDLPEAATDAGAMFADALIAEATAIVGARHVANLTDEMALISALVKYVVPATVDALYRDATRFLGARSQLSGIAGAGLFEKAARDNRVVGIFDGNSVVNLHAIVNEFQSVAKGARQHPETAQLLNALDPGAPTATLDFTRLRLITRAGSSLVSAVEPLVGMLPAESPPAFNRVVKVFTSAVAVLIQDVSSIPRTAAPGAAHFDIARRLAEAFAGASCLALVLQNSSASGLANETVWATAALSRVCQRMGRPVQGAAASYAELHELALATHHRGTTVSLFDGWTA